MKIQNITIRNFKGIKNVNKDIDGKNVWLIGGNGTGKTSFIDAIWCGLTGKNLPPEPTTDGAKKGQIDIDLGDCIARTKFVKGRPAVFEMEDKKNQQPIKSPRSFLKKKIGIIDFDINDFFNKSNQQKLDYFSKILDIDFSDYDADLEEAIESRKFDKKRLAEIETTLNYYNEEDAEKELIDVVSLANRINYERNKMQEYHRIEDGVREKKQQIKDLQDEVDNAESWLSKKENEPIDISDLENLKETLNKSESINNQIQEAKAAKLSDKKYKELKNIIEETQNDIDDLREKKAKKISDNLPIPGLVYDVNGEQFMYNNLPLDENQQNTADQLIVGMKIAASLLKELKILKVDASLIDSKNFDKVLEWSKTQDIELFVELVDRDSTKLQIKVEE